MGWYKQTSQFVNVQEDLHSQIGEAFDILFYIINDDNIETVKKNSEKPFYTFIIKSPYFSKIIVDPIPVPAYFFNIPGKAPATLITSLQSALDTFKNPKNLEVLEGPNPHKYALYDKISGEYETFVSYINVNLTGISGKGMSESSFRISLYHELIHVSDPAALLGKAPSSAHRMSDYDYYNNPTEFNAYSTGFANTISSKLNEFKNDSDRIKFIDFVLTSAQEGHVEDMFLMLSNNSQAPAHWNEENRKTFLSRIYNFAIKIKEEIISRTQASGMNWYKLAKQQEEEWKWNRLRSWVGTGAILGLAALLAISVTALKEEYARNPQVIEQKLVEYKNTVIEPNAIEPTVTDPNIIEPAVIEPAVTDPNVVSYDLAKVSEMITKHEGKRNKMYLDTKGIPTVGIGFNLDRKDAKAQLKALGLDYNKVRNGKQLLTDKQIDSLFKYTLTEAIAVAKSFLSNFSEHPAHVQEVLINMAFNLGPDRFSGFDNFKAALLKKDYKTAVKEMINSKWHNQVKNRALELEKIMSGK